MHQRLLKTLSYFKSRRVTPCQITRLYTLSKTFHEANASFAPHYVFRDMKDFCAWKIILRLEFSSCFWEDYDEIAFPFQIHEFSATTNQTPPPKRKKTDDFHGTLEALRSKNRIPKKWLGQVCLSLSLSLCVCICIHMLVPMIYINKS